MKSVDALLMSSSSRQLADVINTRKPTRKSRRLGAGASGLDYAPAASCSSDSESLLLTSTSSSSMSQGDSGPIDPRLALHP